MSARDFSRNKRYFSPIGLQVAKYRASGRERKRTSTYPRLRVQISIRAEMKFHAAKPIKPTENKRALNLRDILRIPNNASRSLLRIIACFLRYIYIYIYTQLIIHRFSNFFLPRCTLSEQSGSYYKYSKLLNWSAKYLRNKITSNLLYCTDMYEYIILKSK